jgi:hypothetical protein
MTTSEWISIIALIISSGGFAIQARNWFFGKARLHLSVMADAVFFPSNDKKPRLALTVINRGGDPTMITHMVSYAYSSWWHKLRNSSHHKSIVSCPNIPYRLEVNGNWLGQMLYDNELEEEPRQRPIVCRCDSLSFQQNISYQGAAEEDRPS